MLKNILIGLVLLFLISSLIKNITEYQKNKRFYDTYQSDYQKEKDRNNTLKMKIIEGSDPAELEKTIRNRLNLVKENETAIIVPTPTAVPVIITPTLPPVYKQWIEVFSKHS